MNRTALSAFALSAALLAGCSESEQFNGPFEKVQPATAIAKKPSDANYFEMRKEGKVYVFSDISSMNSFRESSKMPGAAKSQQLDGKTVVFQDRGYTDYNRLVGEYKKAHNIQ
jgi:hypothetical protein